MSNYNKLFSKKQCGGVSCFRDPKSSTTFRDYAPLSKTGMEISGVPDSIMEEAYFVVVYAHYIEYKVMGDSKTYCQPRKDKI